MPKTIDIPKRGEYKFLGFYDKTNEYWNREEKGTGINRLKRIWDKGEFGFYSFKAIKPS